MITSESELRIALQAVLISALAVYGFYGCAIILFIVILPWKPILTAGAYMVQPIVDWRVQKARERREKGLAEIEQEIDVLLRGPKAKPRGSSPAAAAVARAAKAAQTPATRPLQPFKPSLIPGALLDAPSTDGNLSASMAIPPAIKEHVRSLPQGVFTNMNLEVEQVKFDGDTAEACVKFQSPSVTELVIRQRYVLRKSAAGWQVESRQPANGGSKAAKTKSVPVGQQPMRLV